MQFSVFLSSHVILENNNQNNFDLILKFVSLLGDEKNGKKETKKSKETKCAEKSNGEVFYAVARGHKSGV